MIAHLVGGPAHGEEVAVTDNPHRTIEVPKLEELSPLPYYGFNESGDIARVAGPRETHVYRLLHTDGRWAIYRWEPPRVTAHFQFTVSEFDYAGKLYSKLHDLTEEGEAVKVLSIHYDGRRECEVIGIVIVDGPPDAKAVADASAAVKAVIERKLRGYPISGFAVDARG